MADPKTFYIIVQHSTGDVHQLCHFFLHTAAELWYLENEVILQIISLPGKLCLQVASRVCMTTEKTVQIRMSDHLPLGELHKFGHRYKTRAPIITRTHIPA